MNAAVAARLLGDGHRQQRLAPLADLGPLGNMAQPVEVQVGAAIDGDKTAGLEPVPLGMLLQAGEAEAPAGSAMARVSSKMSLIAAQISSVSTVRPRRAVRWHRAESLHAGLAHGHAIGEQPDLVEHHALAGGDRRPHAGGVVGLDADYPHLGAQELDVGGDAGGEPAAPDRHEHRLDRVGALTQDLHADGTLAGDHSGSS